MKSIAPLLRKKWLLAVIAAAVVGSGAYAFAATLTVNTATLGAGNKTVDTCAHTVSATYATAYDNNAAGTGGQFAVSTVALNFAATTSCAAGDKIEVVLTGDGNAPLAGFIYTVQPGDVAVGNGPLIQGGTLVVQAGSTTPYTAGPEGATNTSAGTTPAYVLGTGGIAAPPTDAGIPTSFVDPASAVTASGAIPAQNVTGIAISAAGAAAA